ncbi:hypothetical protein [Yersinia frederiksenii]|uniref:hypothetical protein n=1 Tax=Yersinia frederiksenii TaxID=29484 RepID=UPI0006803FED|nr:hypothetical protein [Yersinia frederiksenii]
MDITKSREEFEKVILAMGMLIVRSRGGAYDVEEVELSWIIWQASRESIVIDLPQKISEFNKMPDNGAILLEAVNYDEAIDDCAEAIRSAGIRIKGESE